VVFGGWAGRGMRQRFDIFISYAHADAEAVGRLVMALEARGLAV